MTIRGFHTVHELYDLRAAYLHMMRALYVAAQLSTNDWRRVDEAGYAAFSVAQSKFDAALQNIDARVLSSLNAASADSTPSWDEVTCVDLRGDVFDAYVQVWRGDVEWPHLGGFNAMNRLYLDAMRAHPAEVQAPDSTPPPQPTAPDFDLDAYKLADGAVKWVERNVLSPGTTVVTIVALVGGLYLLGKVLGGRR